MYFPYFITYMLAGFGLSLVVFLWALKNGQFQEQERARFLPLEAQGPATPVTTSKRNRLEIYALFILAGAGLLSSAAVLIYALMTAN